MTTQVGTSGVSRDELALHFDGELTGAQAHELAAQIDADPELRDELAQLGIVRGLVRESLTAKAAEVPQARFEQIWDEIDRQLTRETASAQPATGSFWSRVWSALGPVRIPVAAAAAAAAATFLVVSFTGDDDTGPGASNIPGAVASTPQQADPSLQRGLEAPAPAPADDRLAQAPIQPSPAPMKSSLPADNELEEDMPRPMKVEAEIHGVEFSGHAGRIAKTGTVTVLYLEEESQPKDTERSL